MRELARVSMMSNYRLRGSDFCKMNLALAMSSKKPVNASQEAKSKWDLSAMRLEVESRSRLRKTSKKVVDTRAPPRPLSPRTVPRAFYATQTLSRQTRKFLLEVIVIGLFARVSTYIHAVMVAIQNLQ